MLLPISIMRPWLPALWYFHLTSAGSISGQAKLRPLEGSVRTLEPLAARLLFKRPFASGFRLNVINVKCIYAKVMTDRWCRNDFQNTGEAAVQEVRRPARGSAHGALAEANTGLLLLLLLKAEMLILTFKGQIVSFFPPWFGEGPGKLCLNCSIFRQYYLHGCHFDLRWGHSQPFLFPLLLTALGSSLNCHNLLFCFSVLRLRS